MYNENDFGTAIALSDNGDVLAVGAFTEGRLDLFDNRLFWLFGTHF